MSARSASGARSGSSAVLGGRAHIELYARWLEEQGRARATIARRLSTIVSFYRYAEEEHLIDQSPAVHVRRPKLDYESRAVGLDRNEIGALLVAAGLGRAGDHALISLLALNGLRISEALGANVKDLAVERGHRTLRVLRKGGKTVTIPLAPRTARAGDQGWARLCLLAPGSIRALDESSGDVDEARRGAF